MRFSIRFLMLVIVAISLCVGLPLSRHMARKREAALAKEISWATSTYHHDGKFNGNEEAFEKKYDRETLLEVYRRYSARNDNSAIRISSSAAHHLAKRKNVEGLRLCQKHLDATESGQRENFIYGVLSFFSLTDNIHQTQDFGQSVSDGFSIDSPDDVYLVGTLVCSNFHYGNGAEEMIEYWPSADKLVNSWMSPGQPEAATYATYDDIIAALENFDKEVAENFRRIVGILRSCDGVPDKQQLSEIHELRDGISSRFVPMEALRYLARNGEYFARKKPRQSKPR